MHPATGANGCGRASMFPEDVGQTYHTRAPVSACMGKTSKASLHFLFSLRWKTVKDFLIFRLHATWLQSVVVEHAHLGRRSGKGACRLWELSAVRECKVPVSLNWYKRGKRHSLVFFVFPALQLATSVGLHLDFVSNLPPLTARRERGCLSHWLPVCLHGTPGLRELRGHK